MKTPMLDCSWTRTHSHLVRKRTLNHLAKESLFNKVAGLQTLTQVFSCEYCENFKISYFEEHLLTAASAVGSIGLRDTFFLASNSLECHSSKN